MKPVYLVLAFLVGVLGPVVLGWPLLIVALVVAGGATVGVKALGGTDRLKALR